LQLAYLFANASQQRFDSQCSRKNPVLTLTVLAAAGSSVAGNPGAQTVVIPANLSVGMMFVQADWVVKLVMIGLLVASVVTWTVFVAKSLELRKARSEAERLRHFAMELRSLNPVDLPAELSSAPLVRMALTEFELSEDALDEPDGLKERIVSRFERYEAEVARRMTRSITILGTIGATAPFVGLFGTVWGIMNSFVGIAEKQTTNLAVVAPGIAEALLATALGLVAAIPAVVIYNHFARQIAANRAIVADTGAALLRVISRDLSRGTLVSAVSGRKG
jgi:biopolymer transport protein ExbB